MKHYQLLYVFILACMGCASPLVRYSPIDGQDLAGKVKFRFAESVIKFDFGRTASGVPTDDIIISSVPVPHGDKKYGISGTGFFENWGVVTTINASFRGDSDLIQQVTVAVIDQRQQAIQSLVGAAIALGALASKSDTSRDAVKLPKGISVTNLLARPEEGCRNDPPAQVVGKDGKVRTIDPDKTITCTNMALEGTEDFTADITIGKVPDDAVPVSIMDQPISSANFFYSACRSFTITLKPADTAKRLRVSTTLAIADPRYLHTLRFPDKGNIIVAPSCGANSVAQDANLPTAIDYLNTLATQAKAIKEAFKGTSGVSGAKSGSGGTASPPKPK